MEAVLQDILINTYNPDKQLRTLAENALKNFIFGEGNVLACGHLLAILL